MTLLTVWAEDDPLTCETKTEDAGRIAAALKAVDVRFERWKLAGLGNHPTQEEVLAAYDEQISAMIEQEEYTLVDVAQLHCGPGVEVSRVEPTAATRARFLEEHRHEDDEDRFFAAGSGVFYLHVAGKVYAVLCEAGDLLSVPALTAHWFDMGTSPDFTVIRFFHDEDGWVGDFTGSGLSAAFPTYDQITAAR
jgi:1,2-dihydroxy-3-keto-5-methylthiopentene dioxygenase